jgi:uncharacterized protein YneF (UPF0154 family)
MRKILFIAFLLGLLLALGFYLSKKVNNEEVIKTFFNSKKKLRYL